MDSTTNSGATSQSPVIAPPTSNPPTPVIPKTTPIAPSVSDATAANEASKNYIASQQQIASDAAAAKAAAQANEKPIPKSTDEQLANEGKQSIEDFTTSQQNIAGVNPSQVQQYFADQKAYSAQIDSLNTQINSITSQRDQQLQEVSGNTGGTINFQDAQTARINREANIMLAPLQANVNSVAASKAQASGDFAQANSFVKTAVDSYTANAAADLKAFDDFMTNNQNLINSLTTTEQTAMKNAYDTAQTTYQTQKTDLTTKLNMSVNAGLKLSPAQLDKMSLEDVASQAGQTIATKNASALAYQNSQTAKNLSDVKATGDSNAMASEVGKISKVNDITTWSESDWAKAESNFVQKFPGTAAAAKTYFEDNFPKPGATQDKANTPHTGIAGFFSNLWGK
jgi:hypothetical protein